VGREEHCKQISLVCVGSAHSVWATLGLPQLTVACAFWVYTTQTPGYYAGHCPKQTLHFVHFPGLSHSGSGSRVLHKGIDSFGHAFCAFSRSEQLRQSGAWWAHCSRWVMHLNHLPGTGQLVSQVSSQVCHVSPLGSWSQAVTLLADINCPRNTWLATGSPLTVWWRMPVSGAKIGAAPYLPALAVTRLSLCIQQGRGTYKQQASSPLVFTLPFVL